MKKKILSLAILMTMGVFAYASNNFTDAPNENTKLLVQDDGYKTVEATDLPDFIQEVVKAYEEAYTVESIAYNEAKSLTKLSLVLKANETKSEVILDKEGKLVETETTQTEFPIP